MIDYCVRVFVVESKGLSFIVFIGILSMRVFVILELGFRGIGDWKMVGILIKK